VRGSQLFWFAVPSNPANPVKFLPTLWDEGYIDKTTLYPKAIPPGYSFIYGGRYRAPSGPEYGGIPTLFGGAFILTWEGDAAVRMSFRDCTFPGELDCQTVVGPNRVRAVYSTTQAQFSNWYVSAFTGPRPLRNVRIFREADEAALNSGHILNPRFQAHARRYQVLRFANPQQASLARPFRAGDFARADAPTFTPNVDPNQPADIPKAVNFATIFKMSVETKTAAWVHVAGLPGAPASLIPDSVEVGDPSGEAWRAACRDNLTAILNSPDWGAYMDGLVKGLGAAGYPTTRMVYLEPWNEVWNYSSPWRKMTRCADGVGEALLGGSQFQNRYGYGYLAAHAMVHMDAALRRARRSQSWTLALGTWTAVPEATPLALDGFRRYFTDRGVDPTPWLRQVGVAATSYYSDSLGFGGFIKQACTPADPIAQCEDQHRAKLRAAILASPSNAARARADWIISSGEVGSLPHMALLRNTHQLAAVAGGAYFLGDYEGESHDVAPAYLASDPVIVNWIEDFMAGPEGERVTRAWVAALVAQNPNAIASNYFSIGNRDPEGASPTDARLGDPWVDNYYGETNGRTRGLGALLRN
jgi:hypothetical protein